MEGIDHIVVLMLENRSFDHMLGLLQHDSPEFNGVTPGDPALDNPLVNGKNVAVWSGEGPYFVKEGPGHSHLDVMQQMFNVPTLEQMPDVDESTVEVMPTGQNHALESCLMRVRRRRLHGNRSEGGTPGREREHENKACVS